MPSEEEFIAAYRALRDGYRKSAAETLVEWSVDQLAERMMEQFGIPVTGRTDARFLRCLLRETRAAHLRL